MVNAEASEETAPALITKPGPSTLSSGELGGQPEGLPSLPQACDALITSEREPLAPTQPSLPLVSANPSFTAGRYGSINRGATSPREVMRRAVADLNPAAAFPCLLSIFPDFGTIYSCFVSKGE